MSVVLQPGDPRETARDLRVEAAQLHHQAHLRNGQVEARQVPTGDTYQRQAQGFLRTPGSRGGHRHIEGELRSQHFKKEGEGSLKFMAIIFSV